MSPEFQRTLKRRGKEATVGLSLVVNMIMSYMNNDKSSEILQRMATQEANQLNIKQEVTELSNKTGESFGKLWITVNGNREKCIKGE